VVTELAELNRIRLERDLTYEQLAELTGIKQVTLYRIMTTVNPKLRDRTLYKVQKFLRNTKTTGAAA